MDPLVVESRSRFLHREPKYACTTAFLHQLFMGLHMPSWDGTSSHAWGRHDRHFLRAHTGIFLGWVHHFTMHFHLHDPGIFGTRAKL